MEVCLVRGLALFRMNFLSSLQARIIKVKGIRGSMRHLLIVLVLTTSCADFWMSQVCITDLMHTQTLVQTVFTINSKANVCTSSRQRVDWNENEICGSYYSN